MFYCHFSLFIRNTCSDIEDIDVIIGSLDAYNTLDQFVPFSPTKPYIRDDITWCVKSAAAMPSWLSIFVVFNNFSVALTVTVLFVACCMVFYVFTAFDPKPMNLVSSLIVGYNIMLCFAFPYEAKWTTTRCYLFYCMICAMLVSLHYLSFYTAFMISPRLESQITTVSELIGSNFRLAGEIDTLSLLNNSGKVIFYLKYIIFWVNCARLYCSLFAFIVFCQSSKSVRDLSKHGRMPKSFDGRQTLGSGYITSTCHE